MGGSGGKSGGVAPVVVPETPNFAEQEALEGERKEKERLEKRKKAIAESGRASTILAGSDEENENSTLGS